MAVGYELIFITTHWLSYPDVVLSLVHYPVNDSACLIRASDIPSPSSLFSTSYDSQY